MNMLSYLIIHNMKNMKVLHMIAFMLLLVGGLNWLLVGLAGWDIGELVGGQGALISRVVYILVGLAALWELATHAKNCKQCKACGACSACEAPNTASKTPAQSQQ